MRPPRLHNLGSINRDHVYRVPRLPAGGRTLISLSYTVELGGKGLNQSLAAARAGAPVSHLGAIGEDGAASLALLEASGVSTDWIERLPGPGGHAVIQVGPGGENSILVHPGANARVSADLVSQALARAQAGDWFLAQNETSAVPEAMRCAASLGLRLALNPAPMTEDVAAWPLELVHLLIVNEHECADLSGATDVRSGLEWLARRWPAATVVVTLGAEGCLYRGPSGAGAVPARRVDAVDTTAAGDTFCGYLVGSLALGLDFPVALQRATCASSIAVTRPGAAASIPVAGEVDPLV